MSIKNTTIFSKELKTQKFQGEINNEKQKKIDSLNLLTHNKITFPLITHE